jgi:DNA polymerase III sliding clamp (beta) subunit (PCNA family)
MILMKSNIYPNMDPVWPQSISDYTNTVSFNGAYLLDFLEKVKELADEAVKGLRLAGDSEELTDEEVKKLELLAAGVVNVQTRQDNGSLKLIFTAYNGEKLDILLETPIHYEEISFNGAYLLDFLKLVKRYSSGLVTMTIIRTSQKKSGQFLFTAEIQQGFLESVIIEYLLMPIVIVR